MSNDNDKPKLKTPEEFKANREKYRREINARNIGSKRRTDNTPSWAITHAEEATILQFKRKEPK